MNNDRQKALEFLRSKRGYLKKGNKVVQARLQEERIYLPVDTIKELKSIIKEEDMVITGDGSLKISVIANEPSMKIKSKWQGANGQWLYSYKADESVEAVEYNEEAIKDYISKNVTVSPITPALAHNDLMLNIYTTDKHIGAETAVNSIYSNDYGREEIFDRHEKLVADLLRQKEQFGTFKKCVFYDLGDALDGNNGQTTKGGHTLPQNMDGREQIDTFIEVTIATIEQLIMGDIAEEIWFVATSNDNHCFSQDTEVLTDKGWKLYTELTTEDLVANKNLATEEIIFDKPLDYIYNENVSTKLHEYKNKNINLCVTDEHRILFKQTKYNKELEQYEYILSKNLLDRNHNDIKFQVASKNLKENYNISDDLIKFTAWILTDGTITKYNDHPCGYVIYQSKEDTRDRIREMLNRMGLSYRESIKKSSGNIVCGKQLVNTPKPMTEFALNKRQTGVENMKILMSTISDKKTLPSWLYKLSKRQFDLFLHEYILGDGNVRVDTSACIHGRKEILDQLQTLCILNETKANLLTNNRGHHLLSVTYDRTEATFQLQKQLKEIDYNGYTWCLTMPESNIVTRRNGRVSIQGNSGSLGHGALRSIQNYLMVKYPDIIKTLVTGKFVDHITFGEHAFIFTHGKDDINMKSGMALTINDKLEGFINDYIDRKRIRSKHIHVIKGDLHQDAVTYGKRFRLVSNMSMYGSSDWIHTNFGSGTSGVNYEIIPLSGGEPMRTRIIYQHDS